MALLEFGALFHGAFGLFVKGVVVGAFLLKLLESRAFFGFRVLKGALIG
jgi:hypothetical protein